MTDDERVAGFAALLHRRRRAAVLAWSVFALADVAAVGGVVAALLGGGTTPALVALAAVAAGAVALPVAALLTRDVRGFERDVRDMRAASADRRWPPDLSALVEIAWHAGGRTGRVFWNGVDIAAVLHRPETGTVRITRRSAQIRPGGIWYRDVVTGVMPWVRLRIDGHHYLLAERTLLVDEFDRAYRLPAAPELRATGAVGLELPGELGPLGAVALLSVVAYPRDRALPDLEPEARPSSSPEPAFTPYPVLEGGAGAGDDALRDAA